ncbi:MAG: cystathionine gamma-synthase [Candidatus Eisenbacteria bacterium]|nr:cystathionine gamma-synthase [Candidatus Eisenbacteria bacterium]
MNRSQKQERLGLATRALHAGQDPDPRTGAVTVPVYQTSTYVQEGLGRHKGYEYARTQNPTREAWEACVASLEGAAEGIACASGLAAVGALLQTLGAGDHVVASDDLYGGTYRLFETVYRPLGLDVTYVDTSDAGAVEEALRPRTRYLYVETPTNPLMKVSDIGELSRRARARDVLMVVDNTFLTPVFQRPLELGADVVLHSSTKYLNGHSDMVGGIILTSHAELAERLRYLQNAAGAVPGPWDCWLALRGARTIAVRMQRHNENGLELAEYLHRHPKVARVLYPGLSEHPQYEVSRRQCSGWGGMLSCDLGGLEAARRFVEATRLFALAESLGGVESLICHPASMTHAAVPPEVRRSKGLGDGIVRLSVGIEELEDLRRDIDRALTQV